MPAYIKFRGKVELAICQTISPEGKVGALEQVSRIKVPALTRGHCDMQSFRIHPKHGGLSNSDFFLSALARIRRDLTGGTGYFRLDALPEGVTVEDEGFMSLVRIELP